MIVDLKNRYFGVYFTTMCFGFNNGGIMKIISTILISLAAGAAILIGLGIGFASGIPAAENHQYPIHLPAVLVITIGNTVLKYRISVLRSFRFNSDCFRFKKQRK